MASEFYPVIRSKLLEFRARFRRLVFVRGLCCVLSGLLSGLLLLSLIDYLVIMEDYMRYALSSGVYLIAFVVTWAMWVRPLVRVLDERELAAMMEKEVPSLKSKLLSALELAVEDREHESEVFRKQAQLTVVENLQGLVMNKLLPIRLVQGWLTAAIAVILVAGLAAASESGRTLLLRALMPTANIDRVSRNKILVLQPEGGNVIWPEHSDKEIIIQVRGPKLKEMPSLVAEWGEAQAEVLRFKPAPDKDAEEKYITFVAVQSQDMVYRIHAGDAVSRRYTIRSKQRPKVVEYGKTYTFPKYTGLPNPPPDTGKKGDISVLIGTKVKLTLHLNQPVQTAVMHLVTESATNKLDFVPGVNLKQWQLEMSLSESGAYKIHLMTAEKLNNKSPVEYSIEAKPDLSPTVDLTRPGAMVTARPEDIIHIVAEVNDDYGLKRWEHLFLASKKADSKPDWISIHTKRFDKPFPTNKVVNLRWDLLKHEVKLGDTVSTKIRVTDSNGTTIESSPALITVDSKLFDKERIEALKKYRQWLARLNASVTKTLNFCDVLPPDQLEKLLSSGENATRRATAAEALKKLAEANSSWADTVEELPSVIAEAQPGREAAGFSLIGRLGVRLESDWFPRVKMHLEPLEGIGGDSRAKIHVKRLPNLLRKIRSVNKDLLEASNKWLAADEAAVALDLLARIEREAGRMHRVAKADKDNDDDVFIRLFKRQASTGKDLATALSELKELADRLKDDRGKLVISLHDELKKVHETLVAKHAEGVKDRTLLTTGSRWEKAITDALNKEIGLRPLAHELADDAAQARENLEGLVESTAVAVRRLEQALETNEQYEENLAKAKKEGKNVLAAQEKLKVTGEQLDLEWTVAQEVLRGWARMEKPHEGITADYKKDNNDAADAIEAVHEGVKAGRDLEKVKTQLRAIAEALTTLEAAHELALLKASLVELETRERMPTESPGSWDDWERKSTDANTLRLRDWKWFDRNRKALTKKLRKAGLAGEEILSDLEEDAAYDEVVKEMKNRRTKGGFFVKPNEGKTSN